MKLTVSYTALDRFLYVQPISVYEAILFRIMAKDRRDLEKSRQIPRKYETLRDLVSDIFRDQIATRSRFLQDLRDLTHRDLVFYEILRDCFRDFSRITIVLL